jgi:ADP-ribosylglycohydrolase
VPGSPGRRRWRSTRRGSRRIAAAGWRARTSRPGSNGRRAAEVIYTLVGTSLATQESVPAAFAVLAAVPDDPWHACLLAASLGGDCDTIAAMAGAIAGACHGVTAFPPEAIAVIDAQGLDLAPLADALYALRSRPSR